MAKIQKMFVQQIRDVSFDTSYIPNIFFFKLAPCACLVFHSFILSRKNQNRRVVFNMADQSTVTHHQTQQNALWKNQPLKRIFLVIKLCAEYNKDVSYFKKIKIKHFGEKPRQELTILKSCLFLCLCHTVPPIVRRHRTWNQLPCFRGNSPEHLLTAITMETGMLVLNWAVGGGYVFISVEPDSGLVDAGSLSCCQGSLGKMNRTESLLILLHQTSKATMTGENCLCVNLVLQMTQETDGSLRAQIFSYS